MSLNFKMTKKNDDQKEVINPDWIAANRERSTEWCAENHHLFGNSKSNIGVTEIFYGISENCLTLSLRYGEGELRGNTGRAISFNQCHLNFKANLERDLFNLLTIKKNFKPKYTCVEVVKKEQHKLS